MTVSSVKMVKALRELHRPEVYKYVEFTGDNEDSMESVEKTILVCQECRRVEVSDSSHWAETGMPAASKWPCTTAEALGANEHPRGWSLRG